MQNAENRVRRQTSYVKDWYADQRRRLPELKRNHARRSKALYKMFEDVEIIGFEDGYKGLMYADYHIMKPSDFSGILTQGGTILGTSRQPFKQMRVRMRMVWIR